MEVLFIWYPKCSTCQKAKKYLDEHGIKYTERHIVENKPTIEELEKWIKISGKEANKFFNTSGMLFRQMGLTKKLSDMSNEDKIKLLASDGMLIKRPLIVTKDFVLNGFKEKEWQEHLK